MVAEAGRQVRAGVLSLSRVVSVWIFGDLLYAVLPIITLALITASRAASFEDFSLVKEWSFASVVLYGVTIRRIIRLKAELQQDTRSFRLDTAVQMVILMLVIAVLVLALVILHEKNVDIGVNKAIVGGAQLGLFFAGAGGLLVITAAEEQFSALANRMPHTKSRFALGRHLLYRLEDAVETLDYVGYALQRMPSTADTTPTDGVVLTRWYQGWRKTFRSRVDRADDLLAEIKSSMSDNPTLPENAQVQDAARA